MNQSFESKFDMVNSDYNSSINLRRVAQMRDNRQQADTPGSKDIDGNMEGHCWCFSAEKLNQFMKFKRQTEHERYLDDFWANPKLQDHIYDERMEKYLEYMLHIAQSSDDIMIPDALASALAKKAQSNWRLAVLLRTAVAAMTPQWIREDSQSLDLQSVKTGRLADFGNLSQDDSDLECTVNEQQKEAQNRKRRLCRHFLKGYCKRGKACDFLHDSSIFCPDLQKVFLGGLPSHITEASLRLKMAEQGYNVINKPKVLRGFTPQVCLESIEEAQRLIKKGKLMIDGSQVDVRPYEAFVKDTSEKKLPDDIKRSVFLGGLPNGTTGKDIKEELKKLDVKVVNHPLIKAGFTPQVMLGNADQAEMLVNLKKVRIRNTLVDVRPYVNSRLSSNRSKKY